MEPARRHSIPVRTPAVLILFFLIAVPRPAGGQVTVSLSGEEDGASASIHWLTRPVLAFGLSHHQYRNAHWTYVTMSYARRLPGWITQAEADLGAGKAESSFPYRMIRLSATREVVPGRLYLEIEDRYLEIDRLRGNLVRGGVNWFASDAWSLSSSVYASTGGNLGMRYLTARADRTPAPLGFLAGATVGRSEPGFFRELSEAPPGSSREVFGGLTFLTSSGKAMIVLSAARTGNDDRVRASVSWTFAD